MLWPSSYMVFNVQILRYQFYDVLVKNILGNDIVKVLFRTNIITFLDNSYKWLTVFQWSKLERFAFHFSREMTPVEGLLSFHIVESIGVLFYKNNTINLQVHNLHLQKNKSLAHIVLINKLPLNLTGHIAINCTHA